MKVKLVFLLLGVIFLIPVVTATLSVSTDAHYTKGSRVNVTGYCSGCDNPSTIGIQVNNPLDTPHFMDTVQNNQNGFYSTSFFLSLNDPLGTYTVYANSGEYLNQTTFTVISDYECTSDSQCSDPWDNDEYCGGDDDNIVFRDKNNYSCVSNSCQFVEKVTILQENCTAQNLTCSDGECVPTTTTTAGNDDSNIPNNNNQDDNQNDTDDTDGASDDDRNVDVLREESLDSILSDIESKENLTDYLKKVMNFSESKKRDIAIVSKTIRQNITIKRVLKNNDEESWSRVDLILSYNGIKNVLDLAIYDVVPKSFAYFASDMEIESSGAIIDILKEDPIMGIHYQNLSPGTYNISYTMQATATSDVLDDFSTKVFARELEGVSVKDLENSLQNKGLLNQTNDGNGIDFSIDLFWIVVIILIVAIVVIFVLLLKEENTGYKPGKGYTPPAAKKKNSLVKEIKKILKKIKGKKDRSISDYA